MCYFITLVLPPSTDLEIAQTILRNNGRSFWTYPASHLGNQIEQGEVLAFSFRSHCDCDTQLGARDRFADSNQVREISREREKKFRQGWGSAKLNRWEADKMKELSRRERTFEGDPDNWQKIVGELLETGPPYIGLLLHFYSGDQTTERFNFSRKRIPRSGNLAEEFWNLKEDELLLVDA